MRSGGQSSLAFVPLVHRKVPFGSRWIDGFVESQRRVLMAKKGKKGPTKKQKPPKGTAKKKKQTPASPK
jgi:hypothetical protein